MSTRAAAYTIGVSLVIFWGGVIGLATIWPIVAIVPAVFGALVILKAVETVIADEDRQRGTRRAILAHAADELRRTGSHH